MLLRLFVKRKTQVNCVCVCVLVMTLNETKNRNIPDYDQCQVFEEDDRNVCLWARPTRLCVFFFFC
jgi:hypothetical protein